MGAANARNAKGYTMNRKFIHYNDTPEVSMKLSQVGQPDTAVDPNRYIPNVLPFLQIPRFLADDKMGIQETWLHLGVHPPLPLKPYYQLTRLKFWKIRSNSV
jgi:hypothetical protein